MRHESHAETPTVFEVVQRAVAVCDPDSDDELIAPPAELRDWLRDAGVTA